MKNILEILSKKDETWFSDVIGTPNNVPVTIRVMNNCSAQFHSHDTSDEMFIVLSGTVVIDTLESTTIVNTGETYTVPAGIEHRARTEDRAELIVIGGEN